MDCMNRTRRRSGFTLIEVLLVIAILVVLGTVSVVAYSRIQSGANQKSAKLLVDRTVDAVQLYQTQMNRLPETEDGLAALTTPPEEEDLAEKWRSGGGPFLEGGTIPKDPWGNEIQYEKQEAEALTGPGFRVWSYGPDGQDGTEDDIANISDEGSTL